jgi:hypothetical protein
MQRRRFTTRREGFDAERQERAAALAAPLFLFELKQPAGIIAAVVHAPSPGFANTQMGNECW